MSILIERIKTVASLPELFRNLKCSVDSWFRKTDKYNSSKIVEAVLQILLHGMKQRQTGCSYKDLLNDLFWLNRGTLSNNNIDNNVGLIEFSNILSELIHHTLDKSSLCSNLELFFSQRELIDMYYNKNAIFQDESYANAFFICISAVQLREPVLLSFISSSLYISLNENVNFGKTKHRKSSSFPQFAVSSHFFNDKDNYSLNQRDKKISNQVNQTEIKIRNSLRKIYSSVPNIKISFTSSPSFMEVTESSLLHYKEMGSKEISELKLCVNNIPIKHREISDNNSVLPFLEASSSSPNFKKCVNTKNKGAVKKKTNFENKISSKALRERLNTSFELQNSHSGDDSIEVHHRDREIFNSNTNQDNTKNYDLPILRSYKSSVPIIIFLTIFKNLFPIKSDSVGLQIANNLTSKTTPFSDYFLTQKKLVNSDILSSFIGTREGQKPAKPNTNVLEGFMLQETINNNLNIEHIWSNTNLKNKHLASILKSNLFPSNYTDLERENAHFKVSEVVISLIENIKWIKAEVKQMNNNFRETGNFAEPNIESLSVKIESKINKKKPKQDEIIEIVETGTSYLDSDQKSRTPSIAESANEDKDYDNILESYDNVFSESLACTEWGSTSSLLSAESVGLSLISKLNHKKLPEVNELKWLISEEICAKYNVPQDLLPNSNLNICENPDEKIIHQMQRGTEYWAPPRKQIIFTDQTSIPRNDQIIKQKYRCAGCGMRVAPFYSNRFRYCFYLGKFHCTGCHRNHKSIIPAKVLKNWDFQLYSVSLFSYRLLEEIWQYPLFQLSDVAPTLYERVRKLKSGKLYRTQLKYLKDFIITCRFSQSEEKLFQETQTYIIADPDKWSMSDFIDLKKGTLQKNLKVIIDKCTKHVSNCVLCTARGFFCELCYSNEAIFPWQIKVRRCDNCGTCYHYKCFQSSQQRNCFKCYRLARKSFDVCL